MLGSRVGLGGGGAEALPKHSDHKIRMADVHQLVDRALRAVQMHPRVSIGLPAPQRQHQPTSDADRAVELIDDNLCIRALPSDIARRDHNHPNALRVLTHTARTYRAHRAATRREHG